MMQRIAEALVHHRRWISIAAIVCSLLASMGLAKLEFRNDYRMFFSNDNPELIAFDNLQARYARTDDLLIVARAKEGDLFTGKNLSALETLTRQGWQLPGARRVDSLINFQHSFASGDEITVGPIISAPLKASKEDLHEFKRKLLDEPMLVNRILAKDGKTAGVVVSLILDDQDKDAQVLKIADAARNLVAEVAKKHPELEIRLTGSVMLDTAFHDAAESDTRTLIPTMVTLSLLLCWWLMRSLAVALLVGSVIGLSISCAMGLAGLLGIPLSPTAIAAPNIIMTLAVADSIHILVGWQRGVAEGETPANAMVRAFQSHLPFIGFTTLATIASFLTMNFSDAPPFGDLGNITALGVASAFVLTLTFLPALALYLPTRYIGQPRSLVPHGLNHLLAAIRRKPRMIALSGLVGAVIISQAIWLNELDDEFVKYFDQTMAFRQDTDWVEAHLIGIDTLEYDLPSGQAEGIYDPAFLRRVDQFSEWLRQQPEVVHVFSVLDILKKLNRNMHGEDPAFYRIPETRELAAQYFLTYELGLPQGIDLSDRVDVARSGLRLTASLGNMSSVELRNLEQRARHWLAANTPPEMHVVATGPSLMFANISKRNIVDMISGEIIGIAVVALLLGAALRSFQLGILALLPTLIPSAVAFGVWGLLVGQIGLASSVVTAMVLGILADDTVHFLGHYHQARKQGHSRDMAITYAFAEAGQALWITSVILASGFSILALSHFKINSDLGLLTTVILMLGLLADFVLLPALLLSRKDSK